MEWLLSFIWDDCEDNATSYSVPPGSEGNSKTADDVVRSPSKMRSSQLLHDILETRRKLKKTLTNSPRTHFAPRHPVICELQSHFDRGCREY